jgi:acyl-homoserine-lactone acylase
MNPTCIHRLLLTFSMKNKFLFIVVFLAGCAQQTTLSEPPAEQNRWQNHIHNCEIIRDDFGVPHIYGKSDADAVFGLLYAQCEDDFNRVEQNYIWATGRLAEVEGEQAIYSDLRANLFMTHEEAIINYNNSPAWLQKLCLAFADGINFYLYKHPEVQPKLITHFEPWMPMYFSEGSIGGDIEQISLDNIKQFYEPSLDHKLAFKHTQNNLSDPEPKGSNGFAIAGSKTASGNTMLLINPHTSFFFRGEAHVISKEGLNVYGAVTWGQFFVYQGFNEKAGWMHTSSDTDIMDEFEETVEVTANGLFYKHGNQKRSIDSSKVNLKYRSEEGFKDKSFVMYKTHHGPVTHSVDGKWISTAMMWNPVKRLSNPI